MSLSAPDNLRAGQQLCRLFHRLFVNGGIKQHIDDEPLWGANNPGIDLKLSFKIGFDHQRGQSERCCHSVLAGQASLVVLI